MASWKDVSRIVSALPETAEAMSADGLRSWSVRNKPLAWERPLRRRDLEALGDAAPKAHPLCVRTVDVGVKEALVADDPAVYFTTAHFNGYPAVLIRLNQIRVPELRDLIVEVWLTRVTKKMANEYLDTHS
jgi:hypothetical protein